MRELKVKLSEYLGRAATGEDVVVTDRGRPVARLVAVHGTSEFALVALDPVTCGDAALVAERTLCRSLDALHLAAARRAGPDTALVTFEHRQATAARELGMTVLGC